MSITSLHITLFTFLLLFQLTFLQQPQTPSKTLTQKGKLTCSGNISCNSLTIPAENDLITEHAHFDKLKIGQLTSTTLNTKSISTPLIIAKNELNTLYINSKVKVTGEIKYQTSSPSPTSFIELPSNNNQQQPKSIYWKQLSIETETFNNEVNLPLNNAFCSRSSPSFETTYNINITNKPNRVHHYKIEMTFSFNSSLWKKGSIAYIKLNNDLYWLDNHSWDDDDDEDNNNINNTNNNNTIWSNQIQIIINSKFITNNDNYIPLTFGIKLPKTSIHCANTDAIAFKNITILYK